MKKFFWRFMLVLVLAEIAVLVHTWSLDYTRTYVFEAIHTNETCGCSDSYLIFDSNTDASYTWEFAGEQASPILVNEGGSGGDPASGCWHSRATSAAWRNTFTPTLKVALADFLVVMAMWTVLIFRDSQRLH